MPMSFLSLIFWGKLIRKTDGEKEDIETKIKYPKGEL